MKAVIDQLRVLGFQVKSDGDKITWRWEGNGQPDPEAYRPLLVRLKMHKAQALETLRQEQGDVVVAVAHVHAPAATTFSAPNTLPIRDPFDQQNYPPPGLIITLPDRGRPGCWTARRTGSLEPVGRGQDQVEAILDLAWLEKHQPWVNDPPAAGSQRTQKRKEKPVKRPRPPPVRT